jgi:hypothetical protein
VSVARDPQVGIVKIVVEVGDEERVLGFATFHARDFNGDPLAALDLGRNIQTAYEEAEAGLRGTLAAYAWEGVAGLVEQT